VRDRVVYVQEIQIVALGHLRHARSKSEAVGRELKEWVSADLNLVVVDTRDAWIKPDWIRVADEVDVVAAIGEF
jgi:acyl-homoserine lactone acylase PvdQ